MCYLVFLPKIITAGSDGPEHDNDAVKLASSMTELCSFALSLFADTDEPRLGSHVFSLASDDSFDLGSGEVGLGTDPWGLVSKAMADGTKVNTK